LRVELLLAGGLNDLPLVGLDVRVWPNALLVEPPGGLVEPARSTLRWKWVPALPPATAATSVPSTIAASAIRLAVLSEPSSTGMRGRLSWPRTLYSTPSSAPAAARMTVTTRPMIQTPRPCRGAREARHAPGDIAAGVVGEEQDHEQQDTPDDPEGVRVCGARVGEPDGGAGRAEQRGQERGDADGDQPAEQRAAPVEAAAGG
jgi:hypothetical protein